MNIAIDDLKPLIDQLLINGVPLLANMLLPGVGGTVANAVLPSILDAFGMKPEATVPEVAAAIQADPNSAAKLAEIQEKHTSQLDFAKQAIEANVAAMKMEPSFWGRLFVGGWRPAMGWVGVATVGYQMAASGFKLALVPPDVFIMVLTLWGGLAGVRTVEAFKGVARNSLSTVEPLVLKKAK